MSLAPPLVPPSIPSCKSVPLTPEALPGHWRVDIEFEIACRQSVLRTVLDPGSRSLYLGRELTSESWELLMFGDEAAKSYEAVAVMQPLLTPYQGSPRSLSDFEASLITLESKAESLRGVVKLREGSAEAASRAKTLAMLLAEVCGVATVVVALEPARPAPLVRAALESAGLVCGSGDNYYWEVEYLLEGDIEVLNLFGVQAEKQGGFFAVESALVKVTLSCHIALTPKPEHVVGEMVRVARFLSDKLGGQLLARSGRPFSDQVLLKGTQGLCAKLRAAGFDPTWDSDLPTSPPGSDEFPGWAF